MKYALRRTCRFTTLHQADEIIVRYADKDWLYDHNDIFNSKAICLTCTEAKIPGDIDWDWIKSMRPLYKEIYVGVPNFGLLRDAQTNGCKAYLMKYINNFADLNVCRDLGAVYVYIEQPLFSSMDIVKKFGIPVRFTPNIAESQYYDMSNTLHGIWIRPEDIEMYDFGDCVCEFIAEREEAEERFFKVYAQDHEWPMDISMLILDLKEHPATNRLINSELSERRMNCRQRCEETPGGIGCHLCDLEFATSQRQRLEEYRDEVLNAEHPVG